MFTRPRQDANDSLFVYDHDATQSECAHRLTQAKSSDNDYFLTEIAAESDNYLITSTVHHVSKPTNISTEICNLKCYNHSAGFGSCVVISFHSYFPSSEHWKKWSDKVRKPLLGNSALGLKLYAPSRPTLTDSKTFLISRLESHWHYAVLSSWKLCFVISMLFKNFSRRHDKLLLYIQIWVVRISVIKMVFGMPVFHRPLKIIWRLIQFIFSEDLGVQSRWEIEMFSEKKTDAKITTPQHVCLLQFL